MPQPRKQSPALHALSPEEQKDPMLVLDELFDFADPDDARSLLWLWLKTTVTGGFYKQLDRNDREAILVLYEKMLKLVEAAYLLKETKRAGTKRRQ